MGLILHVRFFFFLPPRATNLNNAKEGFANHLYKSQPLKLVLCPNICNHGPHTSWGIKNDLGNPVPNWEDLHLIHPSNFPSKFYFPLRDLFWIIKNKVSSHPSSWSESLKMNTPSPLAPSPLEVLF